jgi:2-polyprenyl-6-methoxyphenol hydroxylase-like FAD-dependent oxidoreductase
MLWGSRFRVHHRIADTYRAGRDTALHAYGAARRPVAQQVVKFADVLTRLATVRPGLRLLRNAVLGCLSRLPAVRSRMAWRLSGLVYR